MSERTRRVCKAVRKDVRSTGDGGGEVSVKSADNGARVESARPRVKVSFNDENLRELEDDIVFWL